ncbi:MAG: hypothetical protein KDK78_10435, partial [Chlamydiia bacterium]|nr:hypothetical protein [Chlamydiia bacterium]
MDPIRPNTPPINGDIPPPAVPSDEIIQSILNELASQALTLIRECPEFQPMLVAVAHSRGQDPEQIFAEDSPTLALVHQLFMETFAPILEDCIRNESTADPSGGADLIDKIQGEFNLFQEKLIGELRPQVTGASFSEQEISTIKRLAHLDLQIYQSALPAIGHPDAEIMGMMTNDMMEANHFALIVPGEKA